MEGKGQFGALLEGLSVFRHHGNSSGGIRLAQSAGNPRQSARHSTGTCPWEQRSRGHGPCLHDACGVVVTSATVRRVLRRGCFAVQKRSWSREGFLEERYLG